MTVTVYNKNWEYQKIYLDIERVEEKEREFILYKKAGFQKLLVTQSGLYMILKNIKESNNERLKNIY